MFFMIVSFCIQEGF